MKDLHKILGVSEDADAGTIKKAYRKLAKENHPDATGGDKKKTERFKEINEAYDVLSDKEKRSAYTRLKNAPVRPDGMPEGFDPDMFARTFSGGGGRAGRGAATFGGGADVSDIFASLFGGGGPGPGGRMDADWGRPGRARQNRGSDVVGTLEVTFAEAALGTRRKVATGSGASVEVSIPASVETGGRLRVAGQGAPASAKGGAPGDLYLEIKVLPDKHLHRSGSDVEISIPITVSEAALGAKVQVPTVEGSVMVTIPAGSSSGAKLRLRGRGIKKGDGARGDQICRIEIIVPKGAAEDTELRRLFDEIERRTSGKAVRDF